MPSLFLYMQLGAKPNHIQDGRGVFYSMFICSGVFGDTFKVMDVRRNKSHVLFVFYGMFLLGGLGRLNT